MMNKADWKRLEGDILQTMFWKSKNGEELNLQVILDYKLIYKIYQQMGYQPEDLIVRWGRVNDKNIVWLFSLPDDVFEQVKQHYQTRLTKFKLEKWYTPRYMEAVQKIIISRFNQRTNEIEELMLD